MKRVTAVGFTLSFATLYSSVVFAHGGGLNSNGCHNQNSNSTYHCHSGPLNGQSFSSAQAAAVALAALDSTSSTTSSAYNRDDYLRDWGDSDSDCINTRHEVLAIESKTPVTFDASGCNVISGLWEDPYTGKTFIDPASLDIDHLVPLKEAHDSGADKWTSAAKNAFANDLLNKNALIAVENSANRSKGSKDPALWLPANTAYQCEYVRNWVFIKNRYQLSIDDEEKTAIEAILGGAIANATRETVSGTLGSPVESDAYFSLGMNNNQDCTYSTKANLEDLINLSVVIAPDEEELNQPFTLYLVAYFDSSFFAINSGGSLVPFDGTVSGLVPFREAVFIKESYEFQLFSGKLSNAISLDLYMAYLSLEGNFMYTPTPFHIVID